MASVYILYSKTIDQYYSGSCLNLKERLDDHQHGRYTNAYTKRATDWEVYFSISHLTFKQARQIGAYIKRMKRG